MTGGGNEADDQRQVFRRTVLGALSALGLAGASRRGAATSHGEATSRGEATASDAPSDRSRIMSELRNRIRYTRARLDRLDGAVDHESNDRLFEDAVVTKFGKTLATDDATGLPTPAAYDSLVRACETGEGFDRIQQGSFDLDSSSGIVDEVDPAPVVDDEGRLGTRPLVQPEAAWSYTAEGTSPARLTMPAPPAFDSQRTGAEMIETYWMALARDIPFHGYDRSRYETITDAVRELDGTDGYRGPGSAADPTSDTLDGDNLFRGTTPGSQTGPFVSQLLFHPLELRDTTRQQKLNPPAAETTPRDYLTEVDDWLKIQKGVRPFVDDRLPNNEFADERRYILTGRDLAERVHNDVVGRLVQRGAQVLLYTMRAPLDDGIPYTLKPFERHPPLVSASDLGSDNPNARDTWSPRDVDSYFQQTTRPFHDFGELYIEKKILEASEHGMRAAWHKKWNVHRRLRPEEYGGRIHAARSAELDAPVEYPIPENVLRSEALGESYRRHDSYLLPQAYAEGSPAHPSYPAGHAVVAGACVTTVKAFFDGDHVIAPDNKVVPSRDGSHLLRASTVSNTNTIAREHNLFDELTVRGELNKLAENIALGRSFAGVHYRSDSTAGIRLGERAAIEFLRDQLTLPSAVGDVQLSLETFDGEEVTIEPTVS